MKNETGVTFHREAMDWMNIRVSERLQVCKKRVRCRIGMSAESGSVVTVESGDRVSYIYRRG